MKIIHITDTHLSRTHPVFHLNWFFLSEKIASIKPDLVVHTGDAAITDPDRLEDLEFAKTCLDNLKVDYIVVPGNHDIGDNYILADGLKKFQPKVCSEIRRERWKSVFGDDFWMRTFGDYQFLGLNTQLIGSGLEAEHQQKEMIDKAMDSDASERSNTIVVLHKPLYTQEDGAVYSQDSAEAELWSIPEAESLMLEEKFTKNKLNLMLSGHLHRYKVIDRDGLTRIWGPSTSFIVNNPRLIPVQALAKVGFVVVELSSGSYPKIEFCTDLRCIDMDITNWLEHESPGLESILGANFPMRLK